ncbi:MAG: sigma-70 family RNA polymerase sigma factor [Herpetosiphon sp.]
MEPQDDERRWIQLAHAGDHMAFGWVVDTYMPQVYKLAFRMLRSRPEAEDAAQEVFLRAYTKLGTFDLTQKFGSWLLSIAAHYCIDVHRRRRLEMVTLDDVSFSLTAQERGPEGKALDNEQQAAIERAIGQLPPGYGSVMVLRYYRDLSYDEIQAITGLSSTALKTRLYRGRRLLQQVLVNDEAEAMVVVPLCV